MAETNSITTGELAPRWLCPKLACCCKIWKITACFAVFLMRMLINPGPAISALNTMSSGCDVKALTIVCANSRGFFFKGLAICIAMLQAMSPCVGSRGRSKVIVGVKPLSPKSGVIAAVIKAVICCFCCASIALVQ